jgi:hypothetical protein
MVGPFLLIRVGRDEEERLDLFIAVEGALRSRRREGSLGTPGHVRHAGGVMHGSAAMEQGRGRCYYHAGPCTWCTMDQEREGR